MLATRNAIDLGWQLLNKNNVYDSKLMLIFISIILNKL